MHTIQWLSRSGLTLTVLLIIAVLPGGSLLLLSSRVRRACVALPLGGEKKTRPEDRAMQ